MEYGVEPNTVSVVHDPFFSVTLTDEQRTRLGLAALLAAVDSGRLGDLLRMASHQRGDVVTVLAILRTVLRKHSGCGPEDALDAADYSAVWDAVAGREAGALVAHWSEPAFLQPPLSQEPHLSKTIEAIGVQFADVGHEIKPLGTEPDPEDWAYALMSGQSRIYVKDNVSGSRWGLTYVLPSDGTTIGSEIKALSDAYSAAMNGDAVLTLCPRTPKASASERLLFLTTYCPDASSLQVASLAWPWLEAPRATRLVQADGRILAFQMTLNNPRVEVKAVNGVILDPHVPTDKDGLFRRIKSRAWDYKFLLNVLFGTAGDGPTPPAVMASNPLPYVRICSLGTDQGKTTGYRERLVNVRPKGKPLPKDLRELGKLSERLIRFAGLMQNFALYPALMRMQGDTATQERAGLSTRRYQLSLEDAAADTVIRLATDAPGDEARQNAAIWSVLEDAARTALTHGETLAPQHRRRWLNIAEGHGYFEWAIRHHDKIAGIRSMEAAEQSEKKAAARIPSLSRQVFGILQGFAMDISADPSLPKMLRTLPEDSWNMGYWRLMARVSNELLHDPRAAAAFDAVIRGLGDITHDAAATPVAMLLAGKDYPENRVARLLEATGEDVIHHVGEAWRYLAAKGVTRMNWSDLAGLAVSAARNDADAADWHRRNIALSYARTAAADTATVKAA